MAEQKKQDVNQLLKVRRDKLADLQANGRDPFQITKFDQTHHSLEVKNLYEAHEAELLKDRKELDVTGLDEEQAKEAQKKDYEERRSIMDASPIHVSIAGRMMFKRVMGKASFCNIQDLQGNIQVYVARDAIGTDSYADFKKSDIGDIFGLEGFAFRTRTGEISIHAEKMTLISKSLQMLPEKFHGLTDTDTRYRQRYVDLIMNSDTKDTFIKRSKILSAIRKYLSGKGFTTGVNQNVTYSGPVYQRYANEDITWEVGEKINFGVDLQLFRSLDLTFDIFRENRRDIFQEKQTVPTYMGTASTKVYGNLAAMRNQGFELAASYNKQFNKDWFVSFKGTFTYAHNEITKYDESPKYPWQSKVGESANMNAIYIADGLFIDSEDNAHHQQQLGSTIVPGDIKYVNVSRDWYGYDDNLTDTDDWVWAKYPSVPEIVYGFGPSIKWKNLDFSFFFQGVAKTSFMVKDMHPFGDNSLRNVLSWIADERWSPDNQNTNATYPRLSRKTNANNTKLSTYWQRNGAFLKLKNAEIGYTHKNMRIYISGSNLLTFAPFKLWDPEQGGGSGLSYPTQRVFNIGFQMTINNK